MSAEPAVSRASVERLLRPKSIAIVGVSPDPGSMGGRSLANLDRFNFSGDIHLVSRTNAEVNGRPCVASIDDLPDGVDAAVLALPQKAILDAVEACGRRGIKGAVVYAAGFAEAGEDGRIAQEKMAAAARAADIALLGPNTLGLTNYVDSVLLAFGPNAPASVEGRQTLAVIAQSGAMMGSVRLSGKARGLAISYAVATGNEAVTGVEDYLACLVDDPATQAIAVFAEQLRRPALFLDLARTARRNGKPIILLHPGRSQKARESAASHTGALSGNYETMRALVASEAVVAVETLDEFLDASEFLARTPSPTRAGPAIMTDSGAFRGLSLDFADGINLTLPDLTDSTQSALAQRLPSFASGSNPLDITAQGLKDMPLYGEAARILLDDEACGSLLVAVMPGSPEVGVAKAEALLPVLEVSPKPKAYVVLGGAAPIDPKLSDHFLSKGIPFFRSPERALRALGHAARYAEMKARAERPRPAIAPADSGERAAAGILPEYQGKAILKAAGVRVPEGALATSVDDAASIAARIGYPVVMKVQSAAVPHKTEVGGVVVNVTDEVRLRTAWDELYRRLAAARPGLTLDGLLIEAMGPQGVEMVVGARRDPDWGPVVLFGLGGVWIEALKDVRLAPADIGTETIMEEIDLLKAHILLDGYRGAAPIDKAALAEVVASIGALMRQRPEIEEIDVNPLVVYPAGTPPLALDALIVIGAAEGSVA